MANYCRFLHSFFVSLESLFCLVFQVIFGFYSIYSGVLKIIMCLSLSSFPVVHLIETRWHIQCRQITCHKIYQSSVKALDYHARHCRFKTRNNRSFRVTVAWNSLPTNVTASTSLPSSIFQETT